jgi:hypothetical protein
MAQQVSPEFESDPELRDEAIPCTKGDGLPIPVRRFPTMFMPVNNLDFRNRAEMGVQVGPVSTLPAPIS